VPFVQGGAELLVRGVLAELTRRGYRTEKVSIPFELAAACGLADRATFTGRACESQLVELYAGALAVVFPPFDEDYGYVTLEALLSHKPVVTTTDAGGPLEFVEHGVNGLVCGPTPQSVGAAITRLADDPRAARSLGDAGYDRARSITWDGVVDRLMADG
jgi:glycosyltransferase involved in cell wall biosynthesis